MDIQEFSIRSDGAALYCRRQGNGAPLLMIHGACVDCDFFRDSAQLLAQDFTVITYDRRGYGRNDEAADDDYSIHAQTEDAARIIQIIGQPCHIVAHSAGAVIAMELTAQHPELVKHLVLYEPAALDQLPAEEKRREIFIHIHALVRDGLYSKALALFLDTLSEPDDRARAATGIEVSHMQKDAMCFIKKEYLNWFSAQTDIVALLEKSVTIGVGEMSRTSHHWIVAQRLSHSIKAPLIYFPGGHNCAYDLPWEFSCMTRGILQNQ